MTWADDQSLVQAAFVLSAFYNVPLQDAASVVLAESIGWPLLIADDELHGLLKNVEADRPGFRMVWLPDWI